MRIHVDKRVVVSFDRKASKLIRDLTQAIEDLTKALTPPPPATNVKIHMTPFVNKAAANAQEP